MANEKLSVKDMISTIADCAGALNTVAMRCAVDTQYSDSLRELCATITDNMTATRRALNKELAELEEYERKTAQISLQTAVNEFCEQIRKEYGVELDVKYNKIEQPAPKKLTAKKPTATKPAETTEQEKTMVQQAALDLLQQIFSQH